MSDISQAPDWWLASDGKWYAPELPPNYVPLPLDPESPSTSTQSEKLETSEVQVLPQDQDRATDGIGDSTEPEGQPERIARSGEDVHHVEAKYDFCPDCGTKADTAFCGSCGRSLTANEKPRSEGRKEATGSMQVKVVRGDSVEAAFAAIRTDPSDRLLHWIQASLEGCGPIIAVVSDQALWCLRYEGSAASVENLSQQIAYSVPLTSLDTPKLTDFNTMLRVTNLDNAEKLALNSTSSLLVPFCRALINARYRSTARSKSTRAAQADTNGVKRLRRIVVGILILVVIGACALVALRGTGVDTNSVSYKDGYATGINMTASDWLGSVNATCNAAWGLTSANGDTAQDWKKGCADGLNQSIYNTQHPGAGS